MKGNGGDPCEGPKQEAVPGTPRAFPVPLLCFRVISTVATSQGEPNEAAGILASMTGVFPLSTEEFWPNNGLLAKNMAGIP